MPRIACPLQSAAQKFPHRTAIIAGKRNISYAQLNSAVNLTQQWLQAQGIHKNNRVALIAPNNLEYVITLWALWRLGAVACLLNPKLPPKALQTQLNQIRCNRVLTIAVVAPLGRTLSRFSIQSGKRDPAYNKDRKAGKGAATTTNKYDLNQEATILFTSGSSAVPKAVVHTFGNHYYNALGSNEHIILEKNDRWLLSLPLYHVSGLGILFRVLLGGATIVLPGRKESLEKSIQKYHITHVSLVPTQLYRLLQNKKLKLPSLKVILLGGAAITENLLEEAIRRGLPIYTTYGLTEMASQVATSAKNRRAEAMILKYRQVKISSGEILVKGRTLFKGYVKGRKISLPVDREGWFRTGDLGILRDKKYLTVLGRRDNMFISGGENIQPEEIEQYLYRIKGIEQAIVVPLKDQEFGFRPVAFIKTRRAINTQKIKSYLKTFLPSFKIPDKFLTWPERQKERLKVSRSTLARDLILSK